MSSVRPLLPYGISRTMPSTDGYFARAARNVGSRRAHHMPCTVKPLSSFHIRTGCSLMKTCVSTQESVVEDSPVKQARDERGRPRPAELALKRDGNGECYRREHPDQPKQRFEHADESRRQSADEGSFAFFPCSSKEAKERRGISALQPSLVLDPRQVPNAHILGESLAVGARAKLQIVKNGADRYLASLRAMISFSSCAAKFFGAVGSSRSHVCSLCASP